MNLLCSLYKVEGQEEEAEVCASHVQNDACITVVHVINRYISASQFHHAVLHSPDEALAH